MKRILLSAVVLSAVGLNAQSKAPAVKTEKAVGIETSQPRATLDVNGDARLQKVEKMTTSTPTEEIFKDCPCVLTMDKYGVIKRIPSDKFMMSDGSTVNPGGPITPTPTPGTGDNQSTGGANLGVGVSATIDNVDDYVVSFIYDGYQLQGKIDDSSNKVVVNIPYTNGNGAQYSEATSTTTTTAASSENGQTSPITMTIKGGTLSSGNGNITAEITTPALYNVKKLAPGEEETIAEFKYTVNGITRKVVLKAVGGVLDKQFSEQTNGEYKHRFIYLPVTVTHNVNGKPYSKVWLNQNLGADYANLDGGHFSPKKVGGDDHDDYKAYGSTFQWGRVDNTGYELVDWSKSDSKKRLYPNAPWYSDNQLKTFTDPCPKGYHTPSMTDWEDLHEALTGYRTEVVSNNNKIYTDTKLKLSAAGSRDRNNGSSFNDQSTDGFYWSSTTLSSNVSHNLRFTNNYSGPQRYNRYSNGFSVRCLKDGQ